MKNLLICLGLLCSTALMAQNYGLVEKKVVDGAQVSVILAAVQLKCEYYYKTTARIVGKNPNNVEILDYWFKENDKNVNVTVEYVSNTSPVKTEHKNVGRGEQFDFIRKIPQQFTVPFPKKEITKKTGDTKGIVTVKDECLIDTRKHGYEY